MPEVFEVYKDTRGEHRFRLKAPNGEVIATGEGYSSKAGCLNGIESIKENVAFPERFETYQDSRGEHRFRLKAANGQIIATGEGYSSEAALKNGIEAVKKYATSAEIKTIE
jgi:uncharacterized protein YegP (UPF0339 family)